MYLRQFSRHTRSLAHLLAPSVPSCNKTNNCSPWTTLSIINTPSFLSRLSNSTFTASNTRDSFFNSNTLYHHRTITTTPSARLASDAPSTEYDASQIQVLQGLDPVRKRPGMYIGSTGQRGLHHLIYEILDNSIDEVQAGHATSVWVELDLTTGWVAIMDDGRGIPTDIHPVTGKSALETVLTVLHAGGKFGGDSSGYSVSGGLHGVGLSVVNALSDGLEITVWRGGVQYFQTYSRGVPQTDLESQSIESNTHSDNNGNNNGNSNSNKKGTQVRFKYDESIFSKTAVFDPETIRSRLRELAFLNSSASIRFHVIDGKKTTETSNGSIVISSDATTSTIPTHGAAAASLHHAMNGGQHDGWELFHYSGGLAEYVKHLNRDKQPFHEPVVFSKEIDGVRVEVALQWCADAFSDTLIGFVNSIKTVDGGTHLDGFKSAVTRTGEEKYMLYIFTLDVVYI